LDIGVGSHNASNRETFFGWVYTYTVGGVKLIFLMHQSTQQLHINPDCLHNKDIPYSMSPYI